MTGRTTWRPLIVSLVALAAATAASVYAALALTGGHLVYAVDDAYIHMAMGRTLAQSGVWGIAADHPGFASSAPGWTLLLAALARTGALTEWAPLALCVAAAVAILRIVDVTSRRLLVTERGRTWLLVALVFVTPMPALIVSGMETLWHLAVVLAFVSEGVRLAQERSHPAHGRLSRLLALAVVMVSLRYESLFVVAGVVVLLARQRHMRTAVLVAAAAATPVAAYAAFSMANGGWWLPTSVVLKGQLPAPGALETVVAFFSDKGFLALFTHWPLPPLVVAVLTLLLVLSFRNPELEGEAEGWLLVAAVTTILHVHLVNLEWMFRYRAYVVVVCVVAVAFGLSRLRERFGIDASALRSPLSRRVVLLTLAATLCGPLAVLSVDALRRGPRGSHSIYLQQYQVARFLAASGDGPVALNDIGAVSYFTRRRVLDLAGLADQPIARARRTGSLDTAGIDDTVRAVGADIAVIYEPWFKGRLAPPREWARVARWTAADSVSTAHPTVSFFSTRPAATHGVCASLRAFENRLPPGVTVAFDAASCPQR